MGTPFLFSSEKKIVMFYLCSTSNKYFIDFTFYLVNNSSHF